jgi:hypothetical protein
MDSSVTFLSMRVKARVAVKINFHGGPQTVPLLRDVRSKIKNQKSEVKSQKSKVKNTAN